MTVTRGQVDDMGSAGFDTTGLNTALSEALCLGIEVDRVDNRVRIPLQVLSLPAGGAPRTDRRVDVELGGVSRIAASLRFHWWTITEPEQTVLPLTLDGLDEAVKTFGGSSLHGWEFFDLPERSWQWRGLLSFDAELADESAPHILEFTLQEGINNRELDVRVWFGEVGVREPDGSSVALSEFIADGKRWWDAHDHYDLRTMNVWHVHPPL
jgi:hypothetical protein